MWRQQAIVEVLQFRLHAEREHFWGAQGESKRRVRDIILGAQIGFLTADAAAEPSQALDWGASTQHAYEELRRQILQGAEAPGATSCRFSSQISWG